MFWSRDALLERRAVVAARDDALRSGRVYREAWSHGHAVPLLREEAGMPLDAHCVAAPERVLARTLAEPDAIAV